MEVFLFLRDSYILLQLVAEKLQLSPGDIGREVQRWPEGFASLAGQLAENPLVHPGVAQCLHLTAVTETK